MASPDLAAQLCLDKAYKGFFDESDTIEDLCFTLAIESWKQTIEPTAWVLPTARFTGVALSLNNIKFLIELHGTIYAQHQVHPVGSGTPHIPDKIDLEEAALLFNKEGMENRARLVAVFPNYSDTSSPLTREYVGAVKDLVIVQSPDQTPPGTWDFRLTFQVIWTVSRPAFRGWV